VYLAATLAEDEVTHLAGMLMAGYSPYRAGTLTVVDSACDAGTLMAVGWVYHGAIPMAVDLVWLAGTAELVYLAVTLMALDSAWVSEILPAV
jgi:hypothetical protein